MHTQDSGRCHKLEQIQLPRLGETGLNRLFGPETDASEFAGAISFGDAQLVAFPVRCVKGAFVYATSPIALARAARALALVEANPAWPATTAETGHCKLVNR